MKRILPLLACLLAAFLNSSCGPSDAEKRAQQVAQAKTGAEAEILRQQLMKVLSDASLMPDSIHFTEAELADYVKAASAKEEPPAPPKKAKATGKAKAKKKR